MSNVYDADEELLLDVFDEEDYEEFVGGLAAVAPTGTPANAYVLEDGVTFYVAEDGSTFYVQEV